MISSSSDVITQSSNLDKSFDLFKLDFDYDLFDDTCEDIDIDSDWMSVQSDSWMQSTSSSDHYALSYSPPQHDFYSYNQQRSVANSNRSWSQASGNDAFVPSSATNTPPPQSRLPTHRRHLSNSTQSTNSPQQHHAAHPQALFDSNHYRYLQQSQYYPTPVHTPTSASFMDSGYGRSSAAAIPRQPSQGQIKPYPPQIQTSGPQYPPHPQQQFNPEYLTPHSATPHTKTPMSANGDFTDRRFLAQQPQPHQQQQYTNQRPPPHLEHTMTQICADEGYNPLMDPQSAQPTQLPSNFSMPDHMQDRLQAANASRQAASPYDIKRDTSPYRPESQLAREDTVYNRGPEGQVQTVSQQRQQQKWNDDQYQYWRHHTRGEDPTHKQETISPKDAYIDDFREPAEENSNGAPLFPQRSGSSTQQQAFDNRQPYGPINGRHYPPTSNFSFQTPGMPASANVPSAMSAGGDFKFAPLARADSSEDTPAHLVSMETSKSEPSSSQEAPPQQVARRNMGNTSISSRPSGSISTADTGTYSCTYIGCPQRFPTPALLQKHKKEAHRPAAGVSSRHSVGAGTASPTTATPRSVSPGSGEAMSQAGPHKCDRTNPSTGKPCNTVFSRPYDLTRHEDTIHARRPKVHCQYCQQRGEEKTFSRADALTRHLRVVHPDVEVRGLHGRRRGL